jgi:hypothetical protein
MCQADFLQEPRHLALQRVSVKALHAAVEGEGLARSEKRVVQRDLR